MKKCLAGLVILLVCLALAATATAQIIKQENGIYVGQVEVNGESKTFPLYCLNKLKKWPDGQTDFTPYQNYLSDRPDTLKKLQRILFAGYPTNGMHFYSLGQRREVSVEEYNRMLQIPEFILEYTDENNQKPFAQFAGVTFVLPEQGSGNGHGILQVIHNLADAEMKNHIYETDFYKAVYCMVTYSSPLQSLANALAPTEINAWRATQYAIWQMLTQENVPDNDFTNAAYYPLASKLLEFAYADEPDILYGTPTEGIQLSSHPVLTYDEAEKGWFSQPLSVRAASNYATCYKLHLPQGFFCLGADPNHLTAGETFRIGTYTKARGNGSIRITAEANWASNVYLFQPVNAADYQNMGGVYRMSQQMEIGYDLIYSVLPKTGDNFPIVLIGGLMLASAMVLMTAGSRRRRV